MAPSTNPIRLVGGAALGVGCVGSLYAWSVFVQPLQAELGQTRAVISAAFSTATVAFTLTMLLVPRAFAWMRPRGLVAAAFAAGALGLAVAGAGRSLTALLLGYGVLFGIANGLAYSVGLQVANDVWPQRRGLATGIVVCAYACGGALFAPLFGWGIVRIGPWMTMSLTALLFVALGALLVALLAPARWPAKTVEAEGGPAPTLRSLAPFWGGFLFGAFAGLLTIGHAAGILAAAGGTAAALALGPVFVSIGNGVGRIGAGACSDHIGARIILLLASGLAAAAQLALMLWPSMGIALAALMLIGLSYGAIAGGYPAAIAYRFGTHRVGAVYGRVFTAWGLAGLSAAPIGGFLFDKSGSYASSLGVGVAAACLAFIIVLSLPNDRGG